MTWDAIVIGSGFGGAMAAHALVTAGQRVLMLERGGWVARGPQNWDASGVGLTTPHYTTETPYDVTSAGRRYRAGAWHCVGGQSVFYGGASFRFRERDFEPNEHIAGDSGAEWPVDYAAMEPFYSHAERLLGVAGEAGTDPTEPWRSVRYPQGVVPLSRTARAIADAAGRLGLRPFRIPLAISYDGRGDRRACVRCGTCDGYACAAEAKNDVATAIIPRLTRLGMTLRSNCVCVRLVRHGSRIAAVECVDRVTGERSTLAAHRFVLAAGALATPHLLLASRLDGCNPAGASVGRYLMRHRNAVVFGVYARQPNPERAFDKQIAIHDFYDGDPASPEAPTGPLGGIQQLTPPVDLVRAYMPFGVRDPAATLVSHATGLLVIAEDQPRHENGVAIDWTHRDRFGLPRLRVHHRHSERDEAAAAALVIHAKRILREAGARITYVHPIETFSHALGTVRMGVDPATSPLDGHGRFRGLDNLHVADASALPRSAGVNPSLTIAANALRIGGALAQSGAATRSRRLSVLEERQIPEPNATS
jgi:choline dehydrogenase-like flavoprotein